MLCRTGMNHSLASLPSNSIKERETYDSDESSTDTKRDEKAGTRTSPNLNPHPPNQLGSSLLVGFKVRAAFCIDAYFIVGRVFDIGVTLVLGGSTSEHKLLDEREKDRDNDGGFNRLTC